VRSGGAPDGVERWRLLGRLLPAEVRERIFEPAFGDLLRSHLTTREGAASRVPFPVRVAATFLGCAGIALPRLVVRHGRLTRFARVGLSVVAVATVVVVILARVSGGYPGQGY